MSRAAPPRARLPREWRTDWTGEPRLWVYRPAVCATCGRGYTEWVPVDRWYARPEHSPCSRAELDAAFPLPAAARALLADLEKESPLDD